MVNGRGGRNVNNVHSNSVSVVRYNNNSNDRKRKASQQLSNNAGRARYNSNSSSSSRGSTPNYASTSSSKTIDHQRPPASGASPAAAGGMTQEQLGKVKSMRSRYLNGKLDNISDAQLFARMDQKLCIFCGKARHQGTSCLSSSSSSSSSSVKKEHPNGSARVVRQ